MSEKDLEKKKSSPPLMSRFAFPKAKYGFYLSIIIIIVVLVLMYKDYLI
jgi:hypothetical protein|tara:strand:+ start:665 stop:811 length:147 start_codon:yes stop_codon:yes gene_type:complete